MKFIEVNGDVRNCAEKCSSGYYNRSVTPWVCSKLNSGNCRFFRNDSGLKYQQKICEYECNDAYEFYYKQECLTQCPGTHQIEYIADNRVYCNNSINITNNRPMTWTDKCANDYFERNVTVVWHPHKQENIE